MLAPAGVTPSGSRTRPLTWLVGCSLRSICTVAPAAGIVLSSATGSGLNCPAARTVNGPTHSPPSVKTPVVKLLSTTLKFCTYWNPTPTCPPAIST